MFVGYGVTAPERNWDDFKGQDVRGKMLVVLVNDPDFEGGEGDFGGKAMTYYGRWTYKYEEAARRGAAGVLIVHETRAGLLRLEHGQELATPTRSSTSSARTRRRATRRSKPGSSATSRDQLFSRVGPRLRAGQGGGEAPRLPARSPSRQRSARPPTPTSSTITSHNVVGILPGKKYPDETVIYSAHWDHLGIGKPDARRRHHL